MSSESLTGYNAAVDLIERNLMAGRGAKTAFIDDRGHYSYAELAQRVNRFANLVRRLGIHPEQRILLCLQDTIDFPTAFLGAIKAGAVPVAVNTQLSADEFAFMLVDSRARAAVVSAPVLPAMTAALTEFPEPSLKLIVSGSDAEENSLARLTAEMPAVSEAAVMPKSPVVSSTRKVMVKGPPITATARALMPTSAVTVSGSERKEMSCSTSCVPS